ILEEGHLTYSRGRRVNYKNTVIILTSNVGGRLISEHRVAFGFSDNSSNNDIKDMRNSVMNELKKQFKPEFLNRVDDIIVFSKLTKPQIAAIAKKMLDGLKQRLGDMGIETDIDERAVELLAEKGYDPVYGARPLRRAIQMQIEDPISEMLLRRELEAGKKVRVKAVGEDIKFDVV
ncbi:MAG: ATP-dependent Clp protease ATP-binding subunit, partial [Clostridia bacterium]|nr:ATP-dependent Clp protease ATP-binding subunit [Clostridia bacterium]